MKIKISVVFTKKKVKIHCGNNINFKRVMNIKCECFKKMKNNLFVIWVIKRSCFVFCISCAKNFQETKRYRVNGISFLY